MPKTSEKMGPSERQEREFEEDLEHLEEDVEREGLWAKTKDLFKKLFAGEEPPQEQESGAKRD